MKVSDLISKLEQLPSDCEVIITDGYEAISYKGDYEVVLFEDTDGKVSVDIGIGGLMVN